MVTVQALPLSGAPRSETELGDVKCTSRVLNRKCQLRARYAFNAGKAEAAVYKPFGSS